MKSIVSSRKVLIYIAVEQEEFDFQGLIAAFEEFGINLHHASSNEIRAFSAEGNPLALTRKELLQSLTWQSVVSFSFWINESTDFMCTIEFKPNSTTIEIEISGTTQAEQLNVLIALMKYLTTLAFKRKLLGFVGDFEDVIESAEERDRLFLK